MMRKELTEAVAELTGKPLMTVANTILPRLQDEKLLPRGTPGRGVEFESRHRVNLLVGAILDVGYGESVAKEVKRWCALPMTFAGYKSDGPRMSLEDGARAAFHFVDGLGLRADSTLGEALAAIVDDMRTGAFEKWREGVDANIVCDIYTADGNALLIIDRPQFEKGVVFNFGPDRAPAPIDRIVRFNRGAFERLAT